MSLCDGCFSPGQCCKRLSLSQGGNPLVFWDDQPRAVVDYMTEKNWPFVMNEKTDTWTVPEGFENAEDVGRSYSAFNYNCTNLLPNGRCGAYENRPDLCRTYEAGSDQLCVHYRGAEAGDPTVSLDLSHF